MNRIAKVLALVGILGWCLTGPAPLSANTTGAASVVCKAKVKHHKKKGAHKRHSHTITGTVLKDGKPVEGATVRVVHHHHKKKHAKVAGAVAAPKKAKKHHAPVVTDAQGHFSIKVHAGKHRLTAHHKSEGHGHVAVSAKSNNVKIHLSIKAKKHHHKAHHHKKTK